MVPLCFLDSPDRGVVLDSSVAINLNATGHAREILSSLPHEVVVVDIVVDELCRGASNGRADSECVSDWVRDKHLAVVRLCAIGEFQFERLVSGSSAETLDDGEAATIAYAKCTKGIATIDEAKATRICKDRFPDLALASTVDLLAHPNVERAIGRVALADAVFDALMKARMSVLPHHGDWVVDLIGIERASLCTSLRRLLRQRNGAS